MDQVRAEGSFRGHKISVPVLNPGAGGLVWLVTNDDSFFPEHYAVEAKNERDAMDELAESLHGESFCVTPDGPDCHDYGFTYDADDEPARKQYSDLGAIPPGVKFAVTLGNKLVLETDPAFVHVAEPHVTGSGTTYDADNLLVTGLDGKGWECLYFSKELPADGCLPIDYTKEQTLFYLGDDAAELTRES